MFQILSCCGCGGGVGRAAVAPIRPLAWELPYVADVAQKAQKKRKKIICNASTSYQLHYSPLQVPFHQENTPLDFHVV